MPRLAVPVEAPAGGPVRAVPLGPGKHVRTLALAWRRKAARAEAFRRLGTVLASVASVRSS
jgi:DNA-binding transcriptional LysR family regulator